MTDSITASGLARLLRVDRGRITRLFEASNPGENPLWFMYETVNAKLADPQVAIGFPDGQPPTVEALLAGELTLLRLQDVVAQTPYSKYTLAKSDIPHIRLAAHTALYSAESLMQQVNLLKGYSVAQTNYIFGLSAGRYSWAVLNRELALAGLLSTTKSHIDTRALVIPQDIVTTALERSLLPHWIAAQDWIDYRIGTFGTSDKTALWNMSTAAQTLGIVRDAVSQLLDDRQLDYIWTPSLKEPRITPDSVRRYNQQGPIPVGAPRPPLRLV